MNINLVVILLCVCKMVQFGIIDDISFYWCCFDWCRYDCQNLCVGVVWYK